MVTRPGTAGEALTRQLRGKTALVTGATGAIGGATCTALAAAGATVLALGRDADRLGRLTVNDQAVGDGLIVPIRVDLTSATDVDSLLERIRRSHPSLGVVVLAAGAITLGPVTELDVDDLDMLYAVNLRAPFLLMQALAPVLRAGHGHVVVLNSSAIRRPRADNSAYAAVKEGLAVISDAFRDALGPDVRVTSIYPGRTASRMQDIVMAAEGVTLSTDQLLAPTDIADLVVSCVAIGDRAEITDLWVRPIRGQ